MHTGYPILLSEMTLPTGRLVPALFGFAFLLKNEQTDVAAPASATVLDASGAGKVPARVARLIAGGHRAEAGLALQGDKRFFLGRDGRACLMFADRGNARVALSDPIGPRQHWLALISAFIAEAQRELRTPVFYKLSAAGAEAVRAAGLSVEHTGAEAIVHLDGFGLDGSPRRELRRKKKQAEKAGVSILQHRPGQVPLDRLQPLADQWAARKGAEKGFSLGRFDPDYIAQFDVLEARVGERTVGFLSLWQSGDGREWSIDLMQVAEAAPHGTMHLLILTGIEMAQEAGATRFSLCAVAFHLLAAPQSWAERLSARIYERQGDKMGLKGLHRFKQCFRPDWEPLYAAAPAGLGLVTGAMAVRSLVNQPPKTR